MNDVNMPFCPVCAQNKWNKDRTASKILALPSKYEVLVCTNCSNRCLHPQLIQSELDNLYSGMYFGDQKSTLSDEISGVKGLSTNYVSDYALCRHDKYARSIQNLKKLNPNVITLLDVGAATGDFVKIALDNGLTAEGIEYSQYAIELAQKMYGLKLENLSLADIKKNAYFDAIHLNHVFEHFNHPIDELKHISRLLKDRGLLYIEIPFQFHFIEKLIFRIKKSSYEFNLHSLHHPYFYTPATISQMLERQGFEILKLSVFDEARYIGTGIKGKIKKALWRILSVFSIGNHIEIYAKKKVNVR